MTSTRRALAIIEDDLDDFTRTKAGERVLRGLQSAGLGIEDAQNLAVVIRECSGSRIPGRRVQVFEALLLFPPRNQAASLCAVVLLKPELSRMARTVARCGYDLDDAEAEVVATAWILITRAQELARPAPTARVLTDAIWTEVRRAAGLRRQGALDVIHLADDFDLEVVATDHLDRWPGLLASAVAHGVLTPRQVQLIAESRIEQRPLSEIARSLGRPYDAVRKDRRRAELALRLFALMDPWKGTE